jgi:hypothetical protein
MAKAPRACAEHGDTRAVRVAALLGRGAHHHPMLLEGNDPARAAGYRRQGPPPPPLARRCSRATARSSDHAASTSHARRELANMRAALLVARELLRCRLAESGHDALLGRVVELLDAACVGTEPFLTPPVSRTPPGACAHPHCICSPLQRGPEGSHEGDPAGDVSLSTQGASSRSTAGVGGPSGSRDKEPPFARRDQAPGMSGTGAEERQAGFMVMAPALPRHRQRARLMSKGEAHARSPRRLGCRLGHAELGPNAPAVPPTATHAGYNQCLLNMLR